MKTEITKGRLKEYFYPTEGFVRKSLDCAVVDYAEIEIIPDGIKKLESNLERYLWRAVYTDEELIKLDDKDSDEYEHIIAYVHFDTKTEKFNKMFIEVHTAFGNEELDVNSLLNNEEKENIISAAIESLRTWRGAANMIIA